MYSLVASTALLSFSGLALARPYEHGSWSTNSTSTAPPASSTSGFTYPLSNGFPNPSNSSLAQIEQQALGKLPNAPPPAQISKDTEISLAFIAFNELFEVAFFTELIQNITAGVSGYTDIPNADQTLQVLKAAQAQEELHELNANNAFKHFTGQTILPCEYNFPVDNFIDAINLTSTFTDVVLSTLPDIQVEMGLNGDALLARGIGSVIGQEGEQNGFYHQILGDIPNQLPFLTAGARDFAFNAILQNFVVDGSCPSLDLLEQGGFLTEFDVFTPAPGQTFSLEDIVAEFIVESFNPGTVSYQDSEESSMWSPSSGLYVTYINQQNLPFSVPILSSEPIEGTSQIKVTASFPGASHDLNGLTIGAITNGAGPFTNPDNVADVTVFGPALIEVNQPI